ncbi:methyltransferase family protein [Epilithonimonas zeae]|uniref:Protein-S-isoprenylcysteine O-methyltransferase Ste14 n=1 Tax=Epilithonimonas zeae TaxID=1416779 RepID=A0A1N6E4F7_9FLAO|nr:isoprenylcysteine carboxylmethyltransferase family protein [Epilithonimonas zeae]SIN77928.1 Protein-S-isoprenylcysteine O-methyltransferase Ste14 [Epilithonimonas zeae]
MELFIKIFLPIYFILFFGISFVAKTIIVARRIKKNPLVLPQDESAYALVGNYFKLCLAGIFVYVILFPFLSEISFLPIDFLDIELLKFVGLTLMLLALIWTIIAQNQMKNSWRIGIDNDMKTELVTSGLFSISRNPIFFGMVVSLVGLFFLTPNAVSLLFLILGYVLIQVQIRLEEEFLYRQHGEKYLNYLIRTRRLI